MSSLSNEQIRFLNRGPTYVSPCQIHILSTLSSSSSSSSSYLSLDQILAKQIVPLRRQLTKFFTKYPVDIVRKWTFEKQIQEQFIQSFSLPIPTEIQQRTLYEKELIQSIQYQLQQNQLVLKRTADEYNTYYLCHRTKFNEMIEEYREYANWYEEIGSINELQSEQQHLKEIIKSIDVTLEQMKQKNLIKEDHLLQLKIGKKTNIHLPYLYFLPETYQDSQVLLRPRLSSCRNSPIQTLAIFLDQLLRPLFENYSQSTTFLNGHDFIKKLEQYCFQGNCFGPSTMFFTFQIHHLFLRVSHDDILLALNQFLVEKTITGRHQRLTIDAIEQLLSLLLRHNIFTYQGKVYRFIKGCPLNLPITDLLCNIYLQYWQRPLLKQIQLANQFYGRYHNFGFLTWSNSSMEVLHECLNRLNETYPDIQITTSISTRVHFLNAHIENQNGLLHTRVYHDSYKQPFLLPYTAHHPRILHRQYFRYTLMRAAQYCHLWEDFNHERLYIELTFLANGYSLDFVEYHLNQFFTRFTHDHKDIPLNPWTYPTLRQRVRQSVEVQQREFDSKSKLIQFDYVFDWGSRYQFNQQFYHLWASILNSDSTFKKYGLKIQLNTKHYYLSNTLFCRELTDQH